MSRSPSTALPSLVDRDHAVAVAVEREPERRAGRRPRRPPGTTGCVAPHSSLMLRPSGAAWMTDRVGAEFARNTLGRDVAHGAVRAVEHDAQAASDPRVRTATPGAPRRSSAEAMRVDVRPPPRGGGSRPSAGAALDRLDRSTSSGSLVPPGAKNLMPLSCHGLCEAVIIAAGTPRCGGQPGHGGRGHTPSDRLGAAGGEPGANAASSAGPDSRVSRPINQAPEAEHLVPARPAPP
jgi:hypothetical protein